MRGDRGRGGGAGDLRGRRIEGGWKLASGFQLSLDGAAGASGGE